MKDFKATQRVVEDQRNYLASHRSSLTVIKGPAQGRAFDLTKPRMTIGRGEAANIPLDDERASRYHVDVTATPEGVELRDLQSTNGTIVNGQSVQACILRDGDTIAIGDSVLRFTTSKVKPEPPKMPEGPKAQAGFQPPSLRQ